VGQLISEALTAHNIFKRGTEVLEKYVLEIMDKCGLQKYMLHRYPHQFSGGQRQRIGIARALSVMPQFVVCDEAVSALDVSIQSQVINLLIDLKEKEDLTYLFISHDLSAVKFISDRIAVMYLGTMVELTSSDKIFRDPLHPYTEALLDQLLVNILDGPNIQAPSWLNSNEQVRIPVNLPGNDCLLLISPGHTPGSGIGSLTAADVKFLN